MHAQCFVVICIQYSFLVDAYHVAIIATCYCEFVIPHINILNEKCSTCSPPNLIVLGSREVFCPLTDGHNKMYLKVLLEH